jgi:hypothetical protein
LRERFSSSSSFTEPHACPSGRQIRTPHGNHRAPAPGSH